MSFLHPAEHSEARARTIMKEIEPGLILKYPGEFEHFLTLPQDLIPPDGTTHAGPTPRRRLSWAFELRDRPPPKAA